MHVSNETPILSMIEDCWLDHDFYDSTFCITLIPLILQFDI